MMNDHRKGIDIDLCALHVDESLFADVDGTTVACALIADAEDAFAARDMSNFGAGTLRLPGAALRKLGVAIYGQLKELPGGRGHAPAASGNRDRRGGDPLPIAPRRRATGSDQICASGGHMSHEDSSAWPKPPAARNSSWVTKAGSTVRCRASDGTFS
ncbi:hypothetical protein ACFPOI_30305 [Nonomuraea angiospora]|uniref:Uncharacterized protein n=1 Tax=Nonomuraea angiospora TaxID=46172 RepID=A0ABR9LVP3_9ACTN|nr:hypothetical protein [Nonomuraea angiospora]MBE1584367.1 hypothetical protein [Nonomuraea angiospora]